MRKDVERLFGVIKKQWRVLYFPFLKKSKAFICKIVLTCLILHNMNVEDQNIESCEDGEEEVVDEVNPDDRDIDLRRAEARLFEDFARNNSSADRVSRAADENEHMRLYQSLINEVWAMKIRRKHQEKRRRVSN